MQFERHQTLRSNIVVSATGIELLQYLLSLAVLALKGENECIFLSIECTLLCLLNAWCLLLAHHDFGLKFSMQHSPSLKKKKKAWNWIKTCDSPDFTSLQTISLRCPLFIPVLIDIPTVSCLCYDLCEHSKSTVFLNSCSRKVEGERGGSGYFLGDLHLKPESR